MSLKSASTLRKSQLGVNNYSKSPGKSPKLSKCPSASPSFQWTISREQETDCEDLAFFLEVPDRNFTGEELRIVEICEEVGLPEDMIQSFVQITSSSEHLVILDDCLLVVWYYFVEESESWVRACLGINCKTNQGVFAHRNDFNHGEETAHFRGPFTVRCSKYVFNFLGNARKSFEVQMEKTARKLMKLGVVLKAEPQQKRCCGIKWTKWPLPPNMHVYLDNVMVLLDDLDQLELHVAGLSQLCEEILGVIASTSPKVQLVRKWILKRWGIGQVDLGHMDVPCEGPEPTVRENSRALRSVQAQLELAEKRGTRLIDNMRMKVDVEELFDQHFLSSLATMMCIPTLIGGFWGMNVVVPLQNRTSTMYWYIIVFGSLIAMLLFWSYDIIYSERTRYGLSSARRKLISVGVLRGKKVKRDLYSTEYIKHIKSKGNLLASLNTETDSYVPLPGS